MTEYTLERVRGLMTDDRLIKLIYDQGYGGWAYKVDDDHAIIGNSPMMPDLKFMDVVEMVDPPYEDWRKMAGKVVWRAWNCASTLKYPFPNEEEGAATYRAIAAALKDADLSWEGWVAGIMCVEHHEDTDISAILRTAGVDTENIEIAPLEDDERGEGGDDG